MSALQTSAIPLAEIRENPHNHRKHFDEVYLSELAASVKDHGVLHPVLVRPAPGAKGKVKYELVYGHCRFRAAGLAGLKAIPANVRELDDRAALEVALIENCRRKDVLPMEEAEGYRELHTGHGVSVEQLAESLGKSPEYVYGRLKLAELKSPGMRRALDAGKVSPSTALLVARIPGEKLQEAAAEKILAGGAWDEEADAPGPMSYRQALRLVQEHYMLSLTAAPFDAKAKALIPEAGACGPCPKRSGNCKALYPEVKSAHLCTDPDCFGQKKAAAFKLEQEAAKAKGQKLLKENKALWDWEGKALGHRGREKYVELGDTCPEDKKKRTYQQLLGEEAKVVLARSPDGKLHQLLEREKLAEALAAAGVKLPAKEGSGHDSYATDLQKEREKERFRERVLERLLGVCWERITNGAAHEDTVLRLLVSLTIGSLGASDALLARLGGTPPMEYVAAADERTLLAVLCEALLREDLSHTWKSYAPGMGEVCQAFGVELQQLEREQREADKAGVSEASAP
ncbi:MAG: ParB/RepB/Spo0J family partition protein [Myxococcaceae bacterium]|nr:ParB/RepB/Spo0J family partition protein [Myxococcaceae bacterium]